MIYAREQLVPMDDECWRAFNAHQHEQLRRETERCERANREKHLSNPSFQNGAGATTAPAWRHVPDHRNVGSAWLMTTASQWLIDTQGTRASPTPMRTFVEGWVDGKIAEETDPATRAVLVHHRERIIDQIELITLRHTVAERREPPPARVVKLNGSAPGRRVV